ncbi:MAG: hypothetical protein Q9211_004151 [Gyalolechia sp. 1 TL-2023]
MFKQAVSSAIAAIKGIISPSSISIPQPFHSNDAAVPFKAGSPNTRCLAANTTSTSPLSMLFVMAPDIAYHGLQLLLIFILIFSLLPVLAAVQELVTSVGVARNKHVCQLTADVKIKDARIRELESQVQQERQHEATNTDEMTQLTKINSERTAASARGKGLLDPIEADRALYQGRAAAADEQEKQNVKICCTTLEARNTKITELETGNTKLHQIIETKDAQIADLNAQNEALKTEVSALNVANAQQASPNVLQQWIDKYNHEKFTSRRYRNEFSKCLDKLGLHQVRLEQVQSQRDTLMKENMTFMDDNISLLTALRNETENCKALQRQVKDREEPVRANVRSMEEEIAELKPFPVIILPPRPVPHENPMAVEPIDISADIRKDNSTVNRLENGIQTLNPSRTISPTMTTAVDPMETGTQVEAQVRRRQSFDPFNLSGLAVMQVSLPNEFDDMIDRDAIGMAVDPADVFDLPVPIDQPVPGAEDPTPGPPNADEPVIDDEMPACPDSQFDDLDQGLFGDDSDYDGDGEDAEWEDVLPALPHGGEEGALKQSGLE